MTEVKCARHFKGFTKRALLLCGIFMGNSVWAAPRIFNEDNRQEAALHSDANYRKWSKSVSAWIENSHLTPTNDHLVKITGRPLKKEANLCWNNPLDRRFSSQVSASTCTGFLVAPNLVMTAGHCIMDKKTCESHSFVFGFSLESERAADSVSVPANLVYKCARVVERHHLPYDPDLFHRDYALVELDRKVKDIEPLNISAASASSSSPLGLEILTIGHPAGLPLKITDGGKIQSAAGALSFFSDLDIFGGSSGSPVLDAKTGSVLGIIVRGGQDYEFDEKLKCNHVVRCEKQDCQRPGQSAAYMLSDVPFFRGAPAFEIVEREISTIKYDLGLLGVGATVIRRHLTPLEHIPVKGVLQTIYNTGKVIVKWEYGGTIAVQVEELMPDISGLTDF